MGDPHTRGGFPPDVPLNRPPSATGKVTLNLKRFRAPFSDPRAESQRWFLDAVLELKVCVAREPFIDDAREGATCTFCGNWFRDLVRGDYCAIDGAVCRSGEPGERVKKPGTHISVSHPTRYPTWDELVAVKRAFAPNLELAIYLPRDEDYVNVHENCFHMWEV